MNTEIENDDTLEIDDYTHKISQEDLVERLTTVLQDMDGDDLATLANNEFGIEATYEGDSLFRVPLPQHEA